jgi:chemotaxis protein methyltransferase CheR
MLIKYFNQVGEMWQVSPLLRGMVRYQPFNLLDDPSRLGMFDLVFCRNVLIYLDVPTKAKVLQNLRGILRQDGALMLGGTETVLGVTDVFKPVDAMPGLFVRNDSTLAIA